MHLEETKWTYLSFICVFICIKYNYFCISTKCFFVRNLFFSTQIWNTWVLGRCLFHDPMVSRQRDIDLIIIYKLYKVKV